MLLAADKRVLTPAQLYSLSSCTRAKKNSSKGSECFHRTYHGLRGFCAAENNHKPGHSVLSRAEGASTKSSSNPSGKSAAVNGSIKAATSKLAASAATGAAAPGRSSDGKPVCYVCGSKGHTGDRCKQPYCERCEQFRHVAGECSRACKKCGSLSHRIEGGQPCKNYQCKECGLYGHVYAECPNIICNLCNDYGHLARDCPHKGKSPSNSNIAHVITAAPASAQVPQQSAAATPPPEKQQQQPQQTPVPLSAEDAQRMARIMDVLISRVEEYAVSLLADEEKMALVCRISEDEIRAILGRANPEQNLDAAAARMQQEQQKQRQQLRQAANAAGSSSNAGSITAAGAAAAAAAAASGGGGGGTVTRTAALNGPTAAGAAASTPSSSSIAAGAASSNGPHKSDAAGRAHVCGRCGERGHNRDNCTTPKCADCGRYRHTAGQCSKACRDCGGLDHRTGPGHPMCINYKCRECGLYGHVYAECPNIRCNMCGEVGHKALECPTIVCNICKQKGHKARDCTACGRCGQQGHKSKDCPGVRSEVRCVHCGEWGHMASRCPGPAAVASQAATIATQTAAAVAVADAASAPAAALAVNSNSRAEVSTHAAASSGPAVRSSTADSWAAAAAGRRVVTPTTVKLLPPINRNNAAAVIAAGERRQQILDLLMTRVEGYAAGLVAAEDEVTALSRIADEDIRALLQAPNPEQQLDAAIKHVMTVQQQQAAVEAASAQPQPQQEQQQQPQQYRPAQGSWAKPLQLQQQQQEQQPPLAIQQPLAAPSESELSPGGSYGRSAAGGDTVKPAELPPQFAAALAAEFPGYFPEGWQQYASWRSLEERMTFPEPQNKSRAQYRQRRQHFQALTAQAAVSAVGRDSDASAAGRAGAVSPSVKAEQQQRQEQQQQQLTESIVTHQTYTAVAEAGASQLLMPAADSSADAAAVPTSIGPHVRLLPLTALDEEALGNRFNRVLDLMLPQFESFVQSLNEEKWRMLARIEEADLAGLLMHPQAEQQLGWLLSSELEREQQQQVTLERAEIQLQAQHLEPMHDAQQQQQQQAHQQVPRGSTPLFSAASFAQSSGQGQPIRSSVDEQQQPASQHDALQQQQQQQQPHYSAAVGVGVQQQHYGQYPPPNLYMAPNPATATGLGLNGLGIGMSVGLGLAGMTPAGGAGQAVGPPAHSGAGAYQHGGLQQPVGFQQQLPVTVGLQQLHLGLQQQVLGGATVQQQQQQQRMPYGAPYYRRSSTGTAGDEAREQDLERMIGFLGM